MHFLEKFKNPKTWLVCPECLAIINIFKIEMEIVIGSLGIY